ncbi:MAG: PEP-CTERM sorting domain-containing protein, partial [bacterium]|nr:PEP-CTERM sorting domain-containing protein [bacterium]
SAELTADAGNYLGTLEVIPEPSSLTLLGLGGLMLLRRRRK